MKGLVDGAVLLNLNGAPVAFQTDGQFRMPEDGSYQVVPYGECRHFLNEDDPLYERFQTSQITQVLDRQAAEAMVDHFSGEPLIDYEHRSLTSDDSRAAGWIQSLEVREDGLYMKVRWATQGEEDVRSGAYRYLSPVFPVDSLEPLGGDRYRPQELLGAGLTNTPRLTTLKALCNSHPDSSHLTPDSMDYKATLLSLLNLDNDADDAAIHNAVQRQSSYNVDLDELKAQHQALLAEAVDRDLAEYQDVIADEATIREQLLTNRASTLALLKALKPPALLSCQNERNSERQPLYNKATAVPPQPGANPMNLAEQQDRAVSEYKLKHKCTYDEAWTAVRREKPGLFTDPSSS